MLICTRKKHNRFRNIIKWSFHLAMLQVKSRHHGFSRTFPSKTVVPNVHIAESIFLAIIPLNLSGSTVVVREKGWESLS